MITGNGSVRDEAAYSRWREWQARVDASDRRAAARTRGVLLCAGTALVLWLVFQLT